MFHGSQQPPPAAKVHVLAELNEAVENKQNSFPVDSRYHTEQTLRKLRQHQQRRHLRGAK